MATVIFERGDIFTTKEGAGMVLNEKKAVLVTGERNKGYTVLAVADIPEDALPAKLSTIKRAYQLVLRGALAVLGQSTYPNPAGLVGEPE